MRRHLFSFARSPVGYVVNLLCTVMTYVELIPGMRRVARASDYVLCPLADKFCIADGVQDDAMF